MSKIKITAAFICMSFFFACNSNNKEEIKNPPEKEVIDTVSNNNSFDSTRTIVNRSMIWTVQQESPEKDKLKAPDSTLNTLSSSQLIDLLNQNYPDIHLDFVKTSHDTIYVKIPESTKLTNEMGDTGAENYLASATFTLTELKNVKFVNINMKAGDHAEPGVYSRNDFESLR